MATMSPLIVTVVALAVLGCVADAAVVEHTFHVGSLSIEMLGVQRDIIAVNGKLPGPKIEVHEGDTVVVYLINDSPYNITIHWHGIFQRQTCWADGPNMITQCPVRPGGTYTYKFNIIGQVGTLWWHAHVSFLRATVYGALLIRPRYGSAGYPFPKPHKEATIILGEWWQNNVVDVENEALLLGLPVNNSNAFTINGKPGDLYPNSTEMYNLRVKPGKTYLLRIINAALNYELFYKIAGHSFIVVAVDASYTNPYPTDVIVIAPGQTVDALLVANAPPGRYYMAALVYQSLNSTNFDNTTTRGLLEYEPVFLASQAPSFASVPAMPAFNSTPTALQFFSSLSGLVGPGLPAVPLHVHHHMFVAFGLGIAPCQPSQTKCNQTAGSLAASMNNVSFQFPTTVSLLEAHLKNISGVYKTDFPDKPPTTFDYTNPAINGNASLAWLISTGKGLKVKRLRYGETVEVALQNTAILGTENHPLHLHGFNFFVVAQGLGNYHRRRARQTFNLVNPQVRNTIAVPAGGWAVIRFTADNPGVWIFHCHLDGHLPFGLATVFQVDNGPTPDAVLPPPPLDYPQC